MLNLSHDDDLETARTCILTTLPRDALNMTYAPKIVLELPVASPDLLEPFVEACLRDGVDLIAIVGEGASKMDDLIDEIVVGSGADRNRFVNTSFHENER
jgi:hypothetical protein